MTVTIDRIRWTATVDGVEYVVRPYDEHVSVSVPVCAHGPMQREASATIATLSRQLATAREALEKIASGRDGDTTLLYDGETEAIVREALAALDGEK